MSYDVIYKPVIDKELRRFDKQAQKKIIAAADKLGDNPLVMGRIIIDIPNRTKRHYKLNNKEVAKSILESLKVYALPVEDNPIRLTAEDKADIRAVNRARKGDLIDWKDAELFLDKLD
jgi:hypothetical protein